MMPLPGGTGQSQLKWQGRGWFVGSTHQACSGGPGVKDEMRGEMWLMLCRLPAGQSSPGDGWCRNLTHTDAS